METTRACNLHCVHCAVSQPHYPAGTLSWEAFTRVLPFLRAHRPIVHLNGHGETLLCKRFVEMFEAIVGAGCQVGFQTNGKLLTPELTRRLFDIAGPDRLSYLCFSIDAAEKVLYERIRRDASFDTFCDNAVFVANEKQRRRHGLPTLKFEFVAMRMNVHQLPDTVRLAARLGGREFDVSDLIEYSGMEGQRLGCDLEYARPYFRAAAEAAEETGVAFRVMPVFDGLLRPSPSARQEIPVFPMGESVDQKAKPEPLRSLTVIPAAAPGRVPARSPGRRMVKACRDPWDVTFVQASGEVMPCCILPLPMGNVGRQTLDEIWRSPQYATLRRMVASPTPLPDCTTCIMRGWKPASAPSALRRAVRRAGARLGSLVARLSARGRVPLEVCIVPERTAYQPGESCRGCLSVVARGDAPAQLVDIYVAVSETSGGRLFATDRGLKEQPLPFLAAWEPFSFARLDVFELSVPPIYAGSEISLLAVAVPTGLPPEETSNWLASHSSTFSVGSEGARNAAAPG